MTRKSRREIEQKVESLSDTDGGDLYIAWEDPETGEWYDNPDGDGEVLDKVAADPLMILEDIET